MKRTAFSPHEKVYINRLKTEKKHNMSVQHYHDMYEIYLQLDGKRYLFYDNICYTLSRGDLAVFKPFDIHYAESRESDFYERYVLNFQSDILADILTGEELYLLLEKIKPCVIHLEEEETEAVKGCFERIGEYSDETGFLSKKLLYSSVLQLVMRIIKLTKYDTFLEGTSISPQIIKALEYINKNYKNQITLDDISENALTSKYHLCRRFKEITGATVFEYLNNIRLAKVHSLLLNTEFSINDIAAETGFSAPVNLTRMFKKVYGMSPNTFRKNSKMQ